LLGCPKGGDLVSPDVDRVKSTPSEDLQAVVEPLISISEPKLASFYEAYAEMLERDSERRVIDTTGLLRKSLVSAALLATQKTGLQGKYPGLSDSVDSILVTQLGDDDAHFESQAAIDTFRAMAWALK
jgi:hypothetical protein